MAPRQERRRLQRLAAALVGIPSHGHGHSVGADAPQFFPSADIFPRDETQAGAFVAEHPQWDGRGIKIAIFDTGVDPGAGGLAVTTDGNPKVIDCIDATGSGDVDTSTVMTGANCDASVNLRGVSGRTLVVPSSRACPVFCNPSGRWHLGMVAAYQIFPSGLVSRIKRDRATTWNAKQRELEQRLEDDIATAASSGLDDQALADLYVRLEEARVMARDVKNTDRGPLFDVVAFHDGCSWKALVDTSEVGDLANSTPMSDFKLACEYSAFAPADSGPSAAWLLNYSLNIHSDGDCVEIVVNSGAHGTHVAAITAGHFPQSPELNGIAPGAEIVSVKIADSRLPGSETGTGMIRGLLAAIKAGVHLINMSFGEATSLPHAARIGELLSEAVHRHGIIFVTSAMNSGPALGTVGSPAAQALGTISVGAMISPAMMHVEYSQRYPSPKPDDDGRGQMATFTSRGPTPDGDLGVSICAPGAAIASVPQDTLTAFQLMNGTSMASPNACGGIALLVCAAIAQGISFTSESIKSLVQSTAATIMGQEPFGQGHGLLQVQDAWAELCAQRSNQPLVWFDVSVQPGAAKGIYLREAHEVAAPLEASIVIHPCFREGPEGEDLDRLGKVEYQVRVVLECDDEFVSVPDYFLLMSEPRTFNALVDPTVLRNGVHYSEIRGRNTETGEVAFRVPVTIIIPSEVHSNGTGIVGFRNLSFQPGTICRNFVSVPAGANQMQVSISSSTDQSRFPDEGARAFQLQCLQRIIGRSFDHTESTHNFSADAHSTSLYHCNVEPGYTVEVALAQKWNSLGDGTRLDVELKFFGLETSASAVGAGPSDSTIPRLSLSAVQPVSAVHVRASLRPTMLAPSASLTSVEQAFSANAFAITQLDSKRDMWPGHRLFSQLVLTYEIDIVVSGQHHIMSPLLAGVIYESQYDSQLLLVYDSRKQYVGAGYHRPRPMMLLKGKHTVYLQVRHEDPTALESFVNLNPPVVVSRSLNVAVQVPVSDAFQLGSTPTELLKHGDTATVFFTAPSLSEAKCSELKIRPGDILSGVVQYEAGGGGRQPRKYGIQFVIPNAGPPALDKYEPPKLLPASALDSDTGTVCGNEESVEAIARLVSAVQAAQSGLSGAETVRDLTAAAQSAVSVADELLNYVAPRQLHLDLAQHAYDGQAQGLDTNEEWKAQHERLQDAKRATLEALTLKATALMDILYSSVGGQDVSVPLRLCVRPQFSEDHDGAVEQHEAALVSCVRELASWEDDFHNAANSLTIRWAVWQDRLGLAVRLLRETITARDDEDLASCGVDFAELHQAMLELMSRLGWDHCWAASLATTHALRNPLTEQPF